MSEVHAPPHTMPWPFQPRHGSDRAFTVDQPLDLASLIMQSGAAVAAPAPASEPAYDTKRLHLSAHSGSQYTGMVHIDLSQKSAGAESFDSGAHSNVACLPQPSAPYSPSQLQQQTYSQSISPFGSTSTTFPLLAMQQQQQVPCMVKQESQGLGASDWGLADWLGDMMGPSHLDAPLQLDGDFTFEGLPNFDGAWLSNRQSGQDEGSAAALTEADPSLTSCSFASSGLYNEPAMIDASFTVPDVLDGTAFVWDTGYPQSSFLGIAPCIDSTVLLPQLPSAFAPHESSIGPEKLQCVPALPVTLPVQESGPPSGPSGRAARRAARAARLAASDESASVSSDSRRAPGSEPSHGSDYLPETDGGSAFSEETSVVPCRPSQRSSALAMMPEIGFPRVGRSGGRHPTDAELKAAIAVLQERATSLPSYSQSCAASARRQCLLRYRQKKLRRLDSNTIRYMKRKINADKRPRIKGRFVKAEELHLYRQGLLPGQDGVIPCASPADADKTMTDQCL